MRPHSMTLTLKHETTIMKTYRRHMVLSNQFCIKIPDSPAYSLHWTMAAGMKAEYAES